MGLCSLPVIYLGPNYGGGDEDNGDLLQKVPCMHCCTQCPQLCSRPPLTHASTRDSWTLMDKSASVSCGDPFSWGLVHTSFCCALQESISPVLCKFRQLYGGVNGASSKRAYAVPRPLHPEALPLRQTTADPYLRRRHSNTVLSQSLWGFGVLVCTRFVPTKNLFPCPV